MRVMTPAEIAEHLEKSKEHARQAKEGDTVIDDLTEAVSGLDEVDALMAVTSFQADLILQMAGDDPEAVERVWKSCMLQSSGMVNSMLPAGDEAVN